MTHTPPAAWTEAQARHRERTARAEASRRQRFPDLFTGPYGLDWWREKFGATVAWCQQGDQVFGSPDRSHDANRQNAIPYIRTDLPRVRVGEKSKPSGVSRTDAAPTQAQIETRRSPVLGVSGRVPREAEGEAQSDGALT